MNILVTGSKGQLGSEIQMLEKNLKYRYLFTDALQLDITAREGVMSFFKNNKIDLVVNCAAYTQVDKAEVETEIAYKVNCQAVGYLVDACRQYNAKMIHISTDYVFSGNKNTPYTEQDLEAPIGVYGKTKFEGEQIIKQSAIPYLIIRTSWLYSQFGHNFLKTIMRLSAEQELLKVVYDQVGTPTNAADLAQFIVYVVENDLLNNQQEIYHFSNEGVCSWYDFASAIVRLKKRSSVVKPCFSDEFPSKVTRPNYSVLDKTKLKKDFGWHINNWYDSLEKCINNM
ncbi:MAG: dTDP-4-dehydrorhamnose reductase [Bacteroidota bacterium]|nr:dTDP-4-dehydrorhamnose reductase [Bacteroidota bacterium]